MNQQVTETQQNAKQNTETITLCHKSEQRELMFLGKFTQIYQADNRPWDSLVRSVTQICSVCPVLSSVWGAVSVHFGRPDVFSRQQGRRDSPGNDELDERD